MQFKSKIGKLETLASPCLVVGFYQNKPLKLSSVAKSLDAASNKQLSGLLKSEHNDGMTTLLVHAPQGIKAKRVLLVDLGTQETSNNQSLQDAVTAATKLLTTININSIDFALIEDDQDNARSKRLARCLVEAVNKALYRYDETKSNKAKKPKINSVSIVVNKKQAVAVDKGIAQGSAIANGMTLAKDLANLPGNICTPSYLAKQAKKLEKSLPIKTTVLDEAKMKKLKMGSLLSVSRGSREPAKMIIMEYWGKNKSQAPVVLVGKGLTFDAGGISIKPSASMDEMKYDMCGGASVFGAMVAAAEMKLPINLVGIVPSSENLPDGDANKPGDIVTSMAGKTIEILNTDAEGRLILCDALTYAKRFKPSAVIDIATLTGACVVALGHHACGLFSNNDALANALLDAGTASGDRAWRMPMWEEYDKQLKSNFADLANIGGMPAGSVTAACFLSHFTNSYKWAHLDIAGTAWQSGAQKGATGRPVPLLTEYLLSLCE